MITIITSEKESLMYGCLNHSIIKAIIKMIIILILINIVTKKDGKNHIKLNI